MPSNILSLSSFLLLPLLTNSLTLDCKEIVVDMKRFDFRKLGGPKSVHDLYYERPAYHNTTFTIDICANLERPKDSKKEEECPWGTRICAKKEIFSSGSTVLDQVVPIAGEYTTSHGKGLEPTYTRLKDSDSNNETNLEGLRMELHGGWAEITRNEKKEEIEQKAIIEFLCDKEKTGLEGFEDAARVRRSANSSIRGDSSFTLLADDGEDDGDDTAPELPDMDKEKSLKFISYKMEKEKGVLRLQWKTKYACEDAVDEKDPDDESDPSSGWGFFTWFLIIAFLIAAAYIIFGSWLNYNRYGARGWDLVPHGDTIRDIPYLLRDWAGNLAARLRGDNHGGYSAV